MGNTFDKQLPVVPNNIDITPAPPVTPKTTASTRGVDVSHWNGVVDWDGVKAKGNVFAYAKATEGATVVDLQYDNNLVNAPKAGLVFGAYHFFHPEEDPVVQADLFLRRVGKTDLPPVLDWEVSGGMRNQIQIQRALIWLKAVQAGLGRVPMIYGGPSFLSDLALPMTFKAYPLWIAHYGVATPRIPQPWTSWTFWQSSDANGQDLDLFSGSVDDLKKLA